MVELPNIKLATARAHAAYQEYQAMLVEAATENIMCTARLAPYLIIVIADSPLPSNGVQWILPSLSGEWRWGGAGSTVAAHRVHHHPDRRRC